MRPKGKVCGALLEDGEIVRMHPKGNSELIAYLVPGEKVVVWDEKTTVHGQSVIDILQMAFNN